MQGDRTRREGARNIEQTVARSRKMVCEINRAGTREQREIKSSCGAVRRGIFSLLLPQRYSHFGPTFRHTLCHVCLECFFFPLAPRLRVPEPHTWPLGHCSAYNEPFRYISYVHLSAHTYMASRCTFPASVCVRCGIRLQERERNLYAFLHITFC